METTRSVTGQIYLQLKDEISSCRLRPGARLPTNLLSQRYGVSIGVIREAMAKLLADGLVLAHPMRGFSATPISAGDLADLTIAFIGIQSLCLRRSILIGDEAWEARLCRSYASMADLAPANQKGKLTTKFGAAHEDFQDALVAACDNPWLLSLRSLFATQAMRYKQICLPKAATDPDPMGLAELIVEAARAREVDKAVSLLSESMRINAKRFQQRLEADESHGFLDQDNSDSFAANIF